MKTSNSKIIALITLALALLIAIAGVLIMTDAGQLIGIEKPVIVWYFRYSLAIMLISLLALIVGLRIAKKNNYISKKWSILIVVFWLVCIISTKYAAPYIMFKTQQTGAVYIPISEAKDYLKDDNRVLVVNHNGVQRAFPPEYIWQAHIFGGDYAGDDVVFAYCVMTNLGTPFINDINGEKGNFKVLAQTNNNLLIWDTKSDEIIQQITNESEFSKSRLEPLPVLEMTFRGYKKLFPNGSVLYNTWDTPIEKMLDALMKPEDTWHGDDWMFKTANFDDKRLPEKEHIIGIRDDNANKQLAFTKAFIKQKGVYNFEVGNKKLVISYFPEYETIACFNRTIDGEAIDVENISIFGETPQGTLEQEYIYNSVLWAVWAHYYPNTDVLK